MNSTPNSPEIRIVLPAISDDQISNDLRWLTETLMSQGAETTGGFLGGEFGYGADFDNEVFTMFPFYWGDCECGRDKAEWQWEEDHDHAYICYQNEIIRRGFIDFDTPTTLAWKEKETHNRVITRMVCLEMGLDPDFGSWVHCTCGRDSAWEEWQIANPHNELCGVARPNFLHKPSGSRISWYKYIGRGMETDLKADWRTILAECVASVGA